MKRLILSVVAMCCYCFSFGQGTVTTFPPLINDNGSSGITFEVESSSPIVINDIKNLFNSGSINAEVWYRVGGVQHTTGASPSVSTANGWVQHFTGSVTGNGSTPVSVTGMLPIKVAANTRVGIAILGGLSYQTWVSSGQDVFTDNTLSIYTGQNIGYGGGGTWPNHPRQFLGSVTYDLDIVGNCTPFTNFTIDSITPFAFKVDWTPATSSSSFYLEYGPTGFTPGSPAGTKITGTYPGASQPPVIISGLTHSTLYDLYFGEICNSGNDSTYFPSPRQVITAPICPPVDSVQILNIDSNSVTLTYVGTTDSVNFEWGPQGFTMGTGTTGIGRNDTITINGFSPNMAYDLYLQSDCSKRGDGLATFTGPIGFSTFCGYEHIKYQENFDAVSTGLPDCWTPYFTPGSITPSITVTTGGNPFSPTNQLYMYNSNMPTNSHVMAIGPAIWGLDDLNKQARFVAKTTSSGNVTVEIGTVSSPVAPNSFTLVKSFTLTNTYQEFITEFDAASNYNGTDAYIAIRHGNNANYQNIYLDNFEVDSIPSCKPTSIFDFHGTAGGTTVNLYWTPGSGTSWDIEYGTSGFSLGSGTAINSIDTTESISSLQPNTSYDFYLRDNCGGPNSPFIGPISFLTGCSALTTPLTLPFFDGFEGYSGTIIGDSNICNSTYSFEFRNDGAGRLRFDAGSAFYNNGSAAATLDRSVYGDLNSNFMTYTFNLTNYASSAGIILEFSYAHHGQENHPNDRVWVRGSISDPWVVLYDLNANQSSTAGAYVDVTNLNIVPVLANAGQSVSSSTQIRFGQSSISLAYSTTYSDGYSFDDINLEAVQCPAPSGLTVTNLKDTAATLSWLSGSSVSSYGIWFGPQGFFQGSSTIPGAGSQVNTNSPGFLIDTLSPNTCYEYALRAYCSNGDTSIWIGPFQFCTPCASFAAPYSENFDAQTTNQAPSCWTPVLIGASSQYSAAEVTTAGAPPSPTKQLRLYNYNNDSTMIISPPLSGMTAGDKWVKFSAKTSGSGVATIIVGTVPSTGQNRTVTPLDTFELSMQDQKFFSQITTANGYNGTDEYIVLLHGDATTFQTLYIDDFVYEFIPSCPEPFAGYANNIFPTTADLHWTGGGNTTNYNVDYGSLGFTPSGASSNLILTTSNTASLTGLSANTSYEFYVRDSCGSGDVSVWAGPYSFRTLCNLNTAPYFTGFESATTGALPSCWNNTLIGTTTLYSRVTVSTGGSPRNGSKHLELYNYNNDTTSAILPGFSDLTAGDKRVRFYSYTTATAGSSLIIGTVEHPEKAYTFVPVDTVSLTATSQKFRVNLTTANGYNGVHEYIMIMHGDNGTYQTIYLDDIHYEVIPSCNESSDGKSFNIQANTASLTWTPGGTASNWNVAYGPVGFTPSTSSPGYVSSTNDTVNLSSLTDATKYEWYVQDSCGTGNVSVWEGPFTFSTLCLPKTAPFMENFENSTVGTYNGHDNCWTFVSNDPNAPTSTNTYSWEVRNTAQTSSGTSTGPDRDNTLAPAIGGKFLTADVSYGTSGDTALVISPLIDITPLSNPELQFYYHMWGSTMASLHVDLNDGTGWTRDVVVLTQPSNTSPSDPYKDTTISLSAYGTATAFQVRFRLISSGCCAGDVAIDDIRISDPISCLSPGAFTQLSSSSTSATLGWDTTGIGGSSFEVEYGPAGFALGTGTRTSTSANSLTLSNLQANNLCFEAYVRAMCSANDSSLWTGPLKVCPDAIICTDSIDQYAAGSVTAQSALFIPWQGGAAGDDDVSTSQASSGTQSIHVYDSGTNGFTDIVAYFDTIDSGAWEVSFKFYVPTGKAAYYNIQQNHALSGVNNLWGMEVYMQQNGTALVQYGTGLVTVGNFNYAHAQWIDLSTIIDITNDTIWVEYNGTSTGVGFRYSMANAGQPLQFNGVNFYSGVVASSGESADYYLDDFCVSPYIYTGCMAPTSLSTSNVECDSLELSWNSFSGNTNQSSIIEYGPAGFTPGSGTFINYVNSPQVINGLTPATSYDFYVADTCGASDTSSFTGPVNVSTAPSPVAKASFTYTSQYTASTQDITFDASGSTNADTYSWDFGNGSTGNGVNPTETYGLPNGAFSVKLTVTNSCGSTDDTTIVINTNIGIEEPDFGKSLIIFPNPSEGAFNIEFYTHGGDDLTLEVLSLSGQVLHRELISAGNGHYEGSVDLAKYAKGVYMLKITSEAGIVTRRLNRQ